MPGVFITATGTDAGKTFVTAGLIRALRAGGQKVSALKPVASGFDETDPKGSDPAVLLEALGREVSPAELDAISPWRFKAPLSPDMAARKEGRSIDVEKLAAFCQAAIAGNDGLVLIEGVGGIMVPLDTRFTVLDWMQRLALPIILVGGTYLGAVSHCLSALETLKTRNLLPRMIVINESEGSTVTMDDTLETLSHFCGSVPLIALPRQRPGAFSSASFDDIIKALCIA
ncbi:dethiobiotin synthase [Methyloferula stellata]|uniref:dethiobiotin synthase n=1 Tax=Methyloferula stellata TaxID=876270 RepID=UPI0003808303|nr:dethiobiotin synthase [Methyloferula stellata]